MNSHQRLTVRLGIPRIVESPEIRNVADWPVSAFVYRHKGRFTLTRWTTPAMPWGMVVEYVSRFERKIAKFRSAKDLRLALGRSM